MLVLCLTTGFVTSTIAPALDFYRFDEALPEGGNSKTFAPVFDFEFNSCFPSVGFSRLNDKNPGLRPTGSITGQCRSPYYFLDTSNTLHRYACKTSGGSNYCGHFYALYFEKDQCYQPLAVPDPNCGHRHDWEYAAVWTKDGALTHGSVSAHGLLKTKHISLVPVDISHLKVVYEKEQPWTHVMRFADFGEVAENPFFQFVTPAVISWYEFAGDHTYFPVPPADNNYWMRQLLAHFLYGSAEIPLKDSNFLWNLNRFRPAGYPAFDEMSVVKANPNNPVFTMIDGGDATISPAGDNKYLVDFGRVPQGSRLLTTELKLANAVFPYEPGDWLDGRFDISSAAPFLTTGFIDFTTLHWWQSREGLTIEFSMAGHGPGPVVGEIEFEPIGMIDTGARVTKQPIILEISLDIAPIFDLAARPKRDKIQLTWTHQAGTDHYNVYRSQTQGGPYTLVGSTTSTYSTYLDSELTTGNTYYYVVRPAALNGDELYQSKEAGATLTDRRRRR
jgi:hypothetical protein